MITEEKIFQALADGKVGLPPLAVSLIERKPEPRVLARDPYRPDALVGVSWGRRRWRFLAELKANATPQAFEAALAAVQPAATKTQLNPMVVVPYLSSENLTRLEEAGVSGVDLCGNGFVTVPGEVLVVRTGQPNRFPRSEPIRNVYRGDSSLVGRAFLAKPIYRAVGEIVTTIQERGGSVSFATVSKVLKTLQADLIVGRTSDQITLLQAGKLLDQLATNYRPPKVVERWVGKVTVGERELPKALADAARRVGSRLLLTGAASAPRYSVLGREPVVAVYCMAAPRDVLSAMGTKFEETDRFPNVDLTCTTDGPPYFESVSQDGVEYASPVQAYLELMSGDKRQRETAEQVREYVLTRVGKYREPT
jgi:hypothetical protein